MKSVIVVAALCAVSSAQAAWAQTPADASRLR